jgi:sigma-B regulation protein RsbU (phosphoserine phosphatase)
MDPRLADLQRTIVARGFIDGLTVDRLEALLPSGAPVDRATANVLFAINSAVREGVNDPAWRRVFVEAIRRHLLEDFHSPGEVDPQEAAWLTAVTAADGHYDENEQSLIQAVKYALKTNEVWGGIRSNDITASTPGLIASLFARACGGGKGGDFYYFSVSAGDLITRVALADVLGHGEQVTQVSQWLYHALASRLNNAEGSEVLAELNRLALGGGTSCVTTATVVTLSRPEGRLWLATAGHPPMLLRRRQDGSWQVVEVEDVGQRLSNLPLGVDAETVYVARQVPVRSGDRFFLYSDGVIEAPDPQGGLLGSKQLLSILNEHGDAPLQDLKNRVLDALHRHTHGSLTHDDVTFIVAEAC